MSSSPPPTSPSHRSPLTLLSKLKRQLSKSPVTQHQKQPIEHQYLPIPTVSFSESLNSNQALSTYSCSNDSSSSSSFVLIDHNEQPASFDEYRPFLPLIIQHERLQQQQQQRLAHPRLTPTSSRARILPPLNEPPSPTSTVSSKSPITPIFPSTFFLEGDDDDIMTMSNSEAGSISEYSLPRSLSAYMNEARNVRSRRGRKSGCRTSSDSESRHRRSSGMSVRTPPPSIVSRKSFPPISPPPSCPLPEPPASVKSLTSTPIRPKTTNVMSDGESSSSSHTRSLRNEFTAPPPPPPPTLVPASTLSPAICLVPKTKAKTRPESTATILSDLEIFDSPTYAFTTTATTPTSDEHSDHQNRDDDDASPSTSTRTSASTPTTPRQYGIGRQVLSGSGSGRDFDFIGSRLSSSAKRDSNIGLEKKESRLSFGPESSNAEKSGNVEQQLDNNNKPSAADEGSSEVNQDHPTQSQTRTQIPTRRRVKSNDTNPNPSADYSRRTTYHERQRERSHPEWTLFLGIPRNAAPPLPSTPPTPVSSVLFSTGEPNAIPNFVSTPTITQRHSLLTTHHFLAPTMTMRNRTRSDSALLVSASALAPVPAGAEEHGDDDDDGKSKVTKTKGEDDWTLSLPLVVSPTTPTSASSVEVLRGTKQHSDAPSGSQPVVVVVEEEEEECQPRVGEVDTTTQDYVITVEDVDKGKQKLRQGQFPVRRPEEEEEEEEEEKEEDQDSLILRVPRIVRSCSSYPILPTTTSNSPTHNIHSRLKKSSSTKWMGMGATTSTPNLRRGVSSCTLEEEVMSMLLDDSAAAEEEEDDNESQPSSSKTTKKELAKKKMATLDEDLARFNALLKNGNMSGTTSRPVSSIIESAVAAAAAAAAVTPTPTPTPTTTPTATPTKTKTKTVTLNPHPDSIPTFPIITRTTSSSTLPSSSSLQKKKKSTTSLPTAILKPALKQVKSCEPFLLLEKSSSDGSVVHSRPTSSPNTGPGPVMRFPSSAGRGNLNFFDELGRGSGGGRHGHGRHRGHGETSKASLRLTKSAEWIMGELGDAPPPVPTTTSSKSRPTSASSRASQQQQQRTTTTMSRPTSASSRASQQQQQRTTTTTTMSRPTSASSRVSQQQQQRTTSRSNSPLSTTTTQTPLLPFAHYNTRFSSSSSSSSSSATTTTTSNLKSKGSLGRLEMNGRRGGVPTMPFRAVSMGSMSSGTTTTTAPVESTSDFSTSQTGKQQHHHHHHHHQKRSPPSHLPLHTSDSSSSSASSRTSTSSTQKRHISFKIDNVDNVSRRRSISPPPPPSPIASESSSTLPTPLASAFPLPPSSLGISISELDGVVSIQQKLREFENERGRLQQEQQQQRGKQQYKSYRPPSSASSFNSLVSTASSTATVVPSGDQKMKMRSITITANGDGDGVGQEREEDVQEEEDEDSQCSSMYYTARSSFSHDRCPGL